MSSRRRRTASPARRSTVVAVVAHEQERHCLLCHGTDGTLNRYPCSNYHPDLSIHGACFARMLLDRRQGLVSEDRQCAMACPLCGVVNGVQVRFARMGVLTSLRHATANYRQSYDNITLAISLLTISIIVLMMLLPLAFVIVAPSLAYCVSLVYNGEGPSGWRLLFTGLACTFAEAFPCYGIVAWFKNETYDARTAHPVLSSWTVPFLNKLANGALISWLCFGNLDSIVSIKYRVILGVVMSVVSTVFCALCATCVTTELAQARIPPGSTLTSQYITIAV